MPTASSHPLILSSMTLTDAKARYTVPKIDDSALRGQESAFQHCLDFLACLDKTRAINRRVGSYGLKHMVENPTGREGRPSDESKYIGYVYEGTLILAALASGFRCEHTPGNSLHCCFNISLRSLNRTLKTYRI